METGSQGSNNSYGSGSTTIDPVSASAPIDSNLSYHYQQYLQQQSFHHPGGG